jgi:hypothetical protein
MKDAILAIVVAIISAVYWWLIFLYVYADMLFAGDSRPDLQPTPDNQAVIGSAALICAGVLGYAGLIWLGRRLTGWLRR